MILALFAGVFYICTVTVANCCQGLVVHSLSLCFHIFPEAGSLKPGEGALENALIHPPPSHSFPLLPRALLSLSPIQEGL